MIIARPTVREERWLVLAGRYPALGKAIGTTAEAGRWKTTTWLGRVFGFLLGLVGVSMLGGVLFAFPAPLLVGGATLLLAAEWLVARRQVLRSGVEEAIYLCGALGVTAQLLVWSRGDNAALGAALLATAVLAVGWRLLNPLFTTIGTAGYSVAIALAGTRLFSGPLHADVAATFCATVALGALVAGGRAWRRPAHDRMLDGLVIAMPWLACGWLLSRGLRDTPTHWLTFAFATGFVAVTVATGVKRRTHAPLVGALGSLAFAGWCLHELIDGTPWLALLAGGAVLLAVAILLDRALRDRDDGITSRALQEPDGADLVQIAGVAQVAPAPEASRAPGVQGQGGGFGGGGASGQY